MQQQQVQGVQQGQKKVLQQQPVQAPMASIKHGEEIKQESLKTTIQSAITDLEQDIDKTVVDGRDKENQAPPPIRQQVTSLNSIALLIKDYKLILWNNSFYLYSYIFIT